MTSAEKFGRYKAEVKGIIGTSERPAPRSKVKSEKLKD